MIIAYSIITIVLLIFKRAAGGWSRYQLALGTRQTDIETQTFTLPFIQLWAVTWTHGTYPACLGTVEEATVPLENSKVKQKGAGPV